MTTSNKRRFSKAVREQLEPILKENRDLFLFEENRSTMLRLVDSAPDSNFFFNILGQTWDSKDNNVSIKYERRPWSKYLSSEGRSECPLENFPSILKDWFALVKWYRTESVLDDPILWGYEIEFLNDFKLTDEDADTAPFRYEQQLILDRYIQEVCEGLEARRDVENGALIEDLKAEAVSVQVALTSESKNGVLKRLSRLWAKARKGGLKYSNWMVGKFVEGLVKEGAGQVFNWTSDNIHKLPYVVDHLKGIIS